ncbi:MAG: ribonuclease HII [Eubacteriales bacterium]|nr:ribonuclease HII [Eubacteriales bacterium]
MSTASEERTARKALKLEQEKNRIEQMCTYEKEYSTFANICGIDEAGRGPLAGPVVAAAVILPKDSRILYVNDSKKLSEKKREELFEVIQREAVSIGVGIASPQRIDEINILQATYEAMRTAINNLDVKPDILLNDAVTIPMVDIKQVPIIKGDAKSLSIASASIIAKVTRDHLMYKYDEMYPEYGFAKHKGYGTKVHMEAIREFGPCPIHRRTFIKNI